jgi:photosystem II stability/assembly factor-like uncharacterized protein
MTFTSNQRNLLVLFLLSAAICYSGVYGATKTLEDGSASASTWSRNGPVVGTANSLAIAASKPSTLYAGVTSHSGDYGPTSNSGIYKTTDGGLNWAKSGLGGMTVYSLAVDPTNFNTVYAGTFRNGLYKSTDGGATWNGPYINTSADVYTLAVSPANPSVLYGSATNLGVIKSTDGGVTWNPVNNGIHFYLLHGIVIDPGNTDTVYAVGGHGSLGGVYKSTDGGANWNVSSTGIPDSTNDVVAIAMSVTNASVLYAATGNDVYKSTDAGANWSKSSTGLPGLRITSIAIGSTSSSIVFAATFNGGVFKTSDGGATWNSAGLNTISVNNLLVDPSNANNIYAGTQGSAVLKSTNGATSWAQCSNAPYGDVRELAVDPNNPATIYANTSDSLYKTPDRAISWLATRLTNNVALIPGVPTHKLVIDPTNPAILYLGVDFVGVLKSTDGGGSWSSVFLRNTNMEALEIDPSNPQTLYLAIYGYAAYKTSDGGGTWNPIPYTPGDPTDLVVDPSNSSVIYAGASSGVAKSTDGGASWSLTALRNPGRSNPFIISLLVHPTNPSILYASTIDGAAYKSTDGGSTWTTVFTDVAGKVLSFAVDPNSLKRVFVGTDQGVYQSINGGSSSGDLSAGLPASAKPVMALAYDSQGKYLYAGTQEGVFTLPLAATASNPLSGRVKDIKGVGIGGVTLTVSGAASGFTISDQTDANGIYAFDNSTGGDTLTPSKTGYVFDPQSVKAVSSSGPTPITGTFNFTGGTSTSTLSGKVTDGTGTGISGVSITLTGSMQRVVQTDANGAYSLPGIFPGGDYTITPSKTGYAFFPSPLGFTNLPSGDQVLPTIVGTTHPYRISGQARDAGGKAISGVEVRLSRTGTLETFSVQTDVSGNYSFSNLASEATYTLTPSKAGFKFNPPSVTFHNPGGDQTANFTGLPLPAVQFNPAAIAVGNGDIKAVITVTRTGDLTVASTVDFATSDGTASQRVHYTIASGTVSFAPGDASKQFSVLITDTANTAVPVTVNLTLSNPVGATLGQQAKAVLTINHNHSWPPGANSADDARFFVRQHYADFLNREADQGGLDYWSGQITQCGNDQGCIRAKRLNVSNAFFYELEYQQTGAYVFHMYRAAFGNNQPFPNPDNSNQTEANKLPAYSVFAFDRARVVGSASLAQGQLDFANLFAQRPQFLAKYPVGLDGPGFVDSVLATIKTDIGVDLTSQRQALIDLFNQAGGNGGRGAVMYRLADDNAQTNPINNRAFIDAEYDRAFVATQYFGYLRRDADIGGFLFWLAQVNSAPLRDVAKQHAMVCSFITSAEYQNRFSSVVTHTNAECR